MICVVCRVCVKSVCALCVSEQDCHDCLAHMNCAAVSFPSHPAVLDACSSSRHIQCMVLRVGQIKLLFLLRFQQPIQFTGTAPMPECTCLLVEPHMRFAPFFLLVEVVVAVVKVRRCPLVSWLLARQDSFQHQSVPFSSEGGAGLLARASCFDSMTLHDVAV